MELMRMGQILVQYRVGLAWILLRVLGPSGDNADEPPAGEHDIGPSTSTNANAPTSHGYPSSARKKKNWDALAQEAEKQEKKESDDLNKDPNSGGDRELNKVFQSLYAGATPEQVSRILLHYCTCIFI
jgi:hypothetical protein